MNKRIVIQLPTSAKTLADFDLDDETIANAVRHAHSERERVSDFAPSNARGGTFYFQFVAFIREHLVMKAKGWVKRSQNGLEIVEHAGKRLRIGYLSASGTDSDEMTSSPRGPMSFAASKANGQMLLGFPANAFETTGTRKAPRVGKNDGFETWFLAIEPVGDFYMAVLALPTDEDGKRFTHWEQKISIATIKLDSEPNDGAIAPAADVEATAPPKAKRKKKPSNDSGSSEATG